MRKEFDMSKYIAIPYVNKGRDFTGVDCWGLVRLIYKEEYGIDLFSLDGEYKDASEGTQIKQVIRQGKSLINNRRKVAPEYGDVVVFNLMGNPCHVGLYIGGDRVLHILRNTNVVSERISSYRLKGRVEGYYEII